MYTFKKYDDGSIIKGTLPHNSNISAEKVIVVPRTAHISTIITFFIILAALVIYRFHTMAALKYNGMWVLSLATGKPITVQLYTCPTGELIVRSQRGSKELMRARASSNGLVFTVSGAKYEAAASDNLIYHPLFNLKRIVD